MTTAGSRLSYLWRRLANRYNGMRTLRRYRMAPGFYFIPGPDPHLDRVAFDLSDELFVHLGDQLFYEPTMHWLKAVGVPFSVNSTRHLSAYFETVQFPLTLAPGSSPANTLQVVPLAMYYPERYEGQSVLVVEFSDPEISCRLSEALFAVVRELLHAASPADLTIDRRPMLEQVAMPKDLPEHVVCYSDYVDSGSFRIRPSFHAALRTKAREMKDSGHVIAHVGSGRDKQRDPVRHDFIDIDLRGQTSPLQLIKALHSTCIVSTISFDNFVMHACAMAGKPAFVKFRGRYTEAGRRHHYQNVNEALAPPGRHPITYL